jgi:hypothetical protein
MSETKFPVPLPLAVVFGALLGALILVSRHFRFDLWSTLGGRLPILVTLLLGGIAIFFAFRWHIRHHGVPKDVDLEAAHSSQKRFWLRQLVWVAVLLGFLVIFRWLSHT